MSAVAPAVAGRLSILHVVHSLDVGGLERMVADISGAQRAHGHRVAVLSLTGPGAFGRELAGSGVQVLDGGKRGAFDLPLIARIRAAAAGADVVHSHNFVPNYYAALALATIPRDRPPLVNTCHNMGSRLAGARLRRLYRLSLLRTARVAGVGTGVAARLVELGLAPPSKVEAVRNGVPLPPRAGYAARAAARAALGVEADARVVASVGRLVDLKNHRLLLEQLPALAAACPDLRLVLVGDGPLRAELEADAAALGVAGRVVFAGARAGVGALLPGFDVFALPSRTEGLSIALLEACAAGLPVVASRVGGNPEIVQHGRTGLLFDSDDGAAMRASLEQLLADAALRRRLGAAARDWVDAHASITALRAGYDAFYARAGARGHRPVAGDAARGAAG